MDLTEIRWGSLDGFMRFRDRAKWRVLEKTVMNPGCAIQCGEFD